MNEVQQETEYLIKRGMTPAKAAKWAVVNVAQGVSNAPRCVVETVQEPALFESVSLESFYNELRQRSQHRNVTFVGD